ncbi:MAG: serine/threonine-protein phosphatase, partial [Candidatus Limiplasma sp.]|nr:serine/threonine-protein phosphatase [Candidatus Limiplasma sp.]
TSSKYNVKGAPPMSEIDGVDLVTEGVVTIDKVLKYAKDYVSRDESYTEWSVQHDASALISRILFEEATDINFFVGRAVNPAHQDVSINFNVKMSLVEELSQCLRKMGKSVKVSYF